jgi:hypothetical protein
VTHANPAKFAPDLHLATGPPKGRYDHQRQHYLDGSNHDGLHPRALWIILTLCFRISLFRTSAQMLDLHQPLELGVRSTLTQPDALRLIGSDIEKSATIFWRPRLEKIYSGTSNNDATVSSDVKLIVQSHDFLSIAQKKLREVGRSSTGIKRTPLPGRRKQAAWSIGPRKDRSGSPLLLPC